MKLLLKTLLLLLVSHNLYGTNLLDGTYSFTATIKEAHNNESYKFKMNVTTLDNNISGDVDYTQDGCSGILTGEIVSDTKVKIVETITKGAEFCDNGTFRFELKSQILSKIESYYLEEQTHSVKINSYHFTPSPKTWDESALHLEINNSKIEIEELEYATYRPQRLIEKALEKKDLSEYFLEHNTTLFHNNQCEKPSLAPKPEPFFESKEKAKNYALAYCSVSFGCRVGVELAHEQLDTAAKRFLGSQGCTMIVRTYQKDNTLLGETAFNLLDAVSYAGCGHIGDGFLSGLMQGGSCIVSAATRLARVSQYIGCIDSKTKEFHNSYLDWKNEPNKRQKECMMHLDILSDVPKTVERYNVGIRKIRDEIKTLNHNLEKLENKLKEVLNLKSRQRRFIEKLNKNILTF